MARSKMMPDVGRSTAMTEMAFSGGAAGSVRHTTHKMSAPFRSQPVAEETHFFRPLMIQRSLWSLATVRTPSPGGGAAALALPPGSLEQNPANGAPLFFKNVPSNRLHSSCLHPTKITTIHSPVP